MAASDKKSDKGAKSSAPQPAEQSDAQDGADSSLEHASKPAELTLAQFVRVSRTRLDQAAGFIRWAETNMVGRFTLDVWKKALADFWGQPVR